MTSQTHPVRRWLPAVVTGAALAAAFAALYIWRNPERPPGVAFVAMLAMAWPILAIGVHVLWFDRERTNVEADRGKDDVERAWITEAAATAFFGTLGGLLALDTIGSALRLSWLSPIGLVHVFGLGLGLFALSYLWVRRQGR